MVVVSDCPRIDVCAPIESQDQPIGVETAEELGECDKMLNDIKLFLRNVIRMRDDKILTPLRNWDVIGNS